MRANIKFYGVTLLKFMSQQLALALKWKLLQLVETIFFYDQRNVCFKN